MKRIIIFLVCLFLVFPAAADPVYILCQPDSFVNVREFPKKTGNVCGRLELGQEVETDGVKKNGYLHIIGTGFEGIDTWVHAGFVTFYPVSVLTMQTEIVSKGRVACRRSIKGTRRKWLKNGTKTVIFAFADDWAITNQGFIQTRFLGGF